MKKSRLALAVPMVFMLISFSIEPASDASATDYTPILLHKDDLKNSILYQQPQDFENPGKIYVYQNFVFIVDTFKGVHKINNMDPENPVKEAFIHIPGIMDISIQNNILYADNAIDLVAINMENFPEIVETDRVEGIFPEPTPPDLEWIPYSYSQANRPENTIIVGWIK